MAVPYRDEYDAEYEPGDTVRIRDNLGNERVVRVESKEAKIKDGRKGINGKLVRADPVDAAPDPGGLVWAFHDKVTEVLDDEPFPTNRAYHSGHH